MKDFISNHWSLFAAIAIFWISLSLLVIVSFSMNNGLMVYALDDAYIHMSIAKNVALHGVWGITRYGFSSSTSSPFWVLLLALAYLMFGVNELAPIIFNILFGTIAIAVAYCFVIKYIKSPLVVLMIMMMAIFFACLPSLSVAGMEHNLHILLVISFVAISVSVLADSGKRFGRSSILLLLVAPVLAMTRYEGLFLIFVVIILLILRRKWLVALAVAFLGILPATIYGAWSISNGWYFFPNSILLNGIMPYRAQGGMAYLMGGHALILILGNLHTLFMFIISLYIMFSYKRNHAGCDETLYAVVIFVSTMFIHMQFATSIGKGAFYRYEDYLIFWGIIVLSVGILKSITISKTKLIKNEIVRIVCASILLLIIVLGPFGVRARTAFVKTPQATNNTYEQQYQMGLFLREYYLGKTIALNDIGAANFLADIKLLDLWGLGSIESIRLRRLGKFNTEEVLNLCKNRGVEIAILYDSWLNGKVIGGIPPGFKKCGQWTINDNVICGDKTVSIYSVDLMTDDKLIHDLKSFSTQLPLDVQQSGLYTLNRQD